MPPTLGYGKPSEQTIDTVNQWMRSSEWYQALLQSFGQDPNNVHLSENQRQQVIRGAQAQGVVIDEGDMEVDPSGNLNPVGHKLRNTLIVAGVAAAAIATAGAAGAFGGAALPSTTIGTGMADTIAGGTGLAGAGTVAAEAGLAPLASTAIGTGMMAAPIAGGTGLATAAGGDGIAALLSKNAGSLLRAGGTAVGNAANAAGNNRLNQEELDLRANGQNITAQSNTETQLGDRAKLEANQRAQASKDIYRQSYFANRKPGPNNAGGITPLTPDALAGMSALEQQGLKRLQTTPQYGTDTMTPLPGYTPYIPSQTKLAKKGTMESIGDWLSPGLTLGGILMGGKK